MLAAYITKSAYLASMGQVGTWATEIEVAAVVMALRSLLGCFTIRVHAKGGSYAVNNFTLPFKGASSTESNVVYDKVIHVTFDGSHFNYLKLAEDTDDFDTGVKMTQV